MGILQNPSEIEARLPDIVERSKELGVMVPSTSFIVVERSDQWKILKVKERQRLSASEGLEFEEDFHTPAPASWIVLILLGTWYFLQKKRSEVLHQT